MSRFFDPEYTGPMDPNAPQGWQPGDHPCDANDWACQICGKPGGH